MSDEKKRDSKKPQLNWIERLAQRVGYVKKDIGRKSAFETTTLGEAAVTMLQDKKLGERIEVVDILMYAMTKEIPEKSSLKTRVKILKDRLNVLDQTIQIIAAPYARAGDFPRYSKLLHGWNVEYSVATSWIVRVERDFTSEIDNDFKGDKALNDNEIVVHDLQLALIQHIFPDAKDVLGYCYKDDDVRAKAVTVIQSMTPQTGYGNTMNINKETENM